MSDINQDQIIVEWSCSETKGQEEKEKEKVEGEDEELMKLLLPDVRDLPLTPPSAVESNFATYFALDEELSVCCRYCDDKSGEDIWTLWGPLNWLWDEELSAQPHSPRGLPSAATTVTTRVRKA